MARASYAKSIAIKAKLRLGATIVVGGRGPPSRAMALLLSDASAKLANRFFTGFRVKTFFIISRLRGFAL